MFPGSYDGDVVEGAAVDRTLSWKSLKRVALTLDFVAVKASVDDGEIDARDALTQPEFVENQRVGLGLVTALDLRVKAAPYVDVTNRAGCVICAIVERMP